MFDMNNMMGKLQEAQAKMKEAQNELEGVFAEGESGAGMVKAKVNGHRKVINIEIDPNIVSKEDKVMLEDLTVAAINKAMENIEPVIKEHMQKNASGFLPNIPGLDLSKIM